MQIPAEHATYGGPSPACRQRGNNQAGKKSSLQPSHALREPHGYWAAQTSHPPNSTRAMAPVDPQCSWQEKVQGLFDPALRDAEDMMLSLPYSEIREKTNTLATVLDQRASRPAGAGYMSTSTPKYRISSRGRVGREPLSHKSDSTVIAQTLYACYESLVAILLSYCQSMSHATEMQARRALTAALAEIDSFSA